MVMLEVERAGSDGLATMSILPRRTNASGKRTVSLLSTSRTRRSRPKGLISLDLESRYPVLITCGLLRRTCTYLLVECTWEARV